MDRCSSRQAAISIVLAMVSIGLLSVLLAILIIEAGPGSEAQKTVEVVTNLGRIRGTTLRSRLDTEFYAFRGIRYGKSPTGEIRFKAPVPEQAWGPTTTLDATHDGPMCPQPWKNASEISEDCLRLNIYTKTLGPGAKKAVLFYIPGGGFYVGSGVSTDYGGPQYLMDRDVVLVTINYRLLLFGYLSLNTTDYPGNAAFKDQVLALQWVRQHISIFGGDPDRITLIGNSAGSFSIAAHMVSPMTRGLFQRGILGSGGVIFKYGLPSQQINYAKYWAGLLDCPIDPLEVMIDCLKAVPMEKYIEAFIKNYKVGCANPVTGYAPVVEADFGQQRYLDSDSYQSFEAGNFYKVPVIVGITKDEFTTEAVDILRNDELRKDLDENFLDMAPTCFSYERGTNRSYNISNTLREAYQLPSPMTEQNSLVPLANLFSDSAIGTTAHRLVDVIKDKVDVYYYKFSYVGRYSHLYYLGDKPYGAIHSDDFIYLLVRNRTAPIFTPSDPESSIIEQITRLWTNFAINGDPNDPSDPYIGSITWPKVSETASEPFLDLGSTLSIQNGLFADRYAIWDRLFPRPTGKVRQKRKMNSSRTQ